MALTIKAIEAAKPDGKGRYSEVKISDGEGLYLVVSEVSKKWRARYYWAGKQQTLSLGKYPAVSLSEARDKNRALRKDLENGINPIEKKNTEKERVRQEHEEQRQRELEEAGANPLLFRTICYDWLETVRPMWKESTFNGEKKRVEKDIIKPFGDMLITEITPKHIRASFKKLADQGKMATLKKVAENAVRVFDFAIALDLCENNPAYSIWKGLPFGKTNSGKSFATVTEPEEIGKLLVLIEEYTKQRSGTEVSTALALLPYLFLRPGCLVAGEWKEIDWKTEEWHIPAVRMKNNKPFVVPLPKQALKILKSLHNRTGTGKFMFPSYSKSGYISSNSLLKFFMNCGYKGVMTSHGFRHMAVTRLKEMRFDSDVIFLQMSHTLERSKAKATYDKAQLMPQRKEMLQVYADYLDELRAKAASAGAQEEAVAILAAQKGEKNAARGKAATASAA